ncbi:MAG TPA: O-antigen ligase family protein [Gammaproteobacteria bacterium]|nr:O-antigen ligase family protein [Gammaproteobacteria bacterium]
MALTAFPSAPATGVPGAIGLLGLALFALGLMTSVAALNIGVGLMLLAMLARGARSLPELWSDSLFRLMLVFLGYVVVRGIWAAQAAPSLASAQFDMLHYYARILYLPIVGWWLGSSGRSVSSMALLVLVGTLIALGMHMNWQHPVQYMQLGHNWLEGRKGFGLNAQWAGLVCVTALAGTLSFRGSWIGSPERPRLLRVARALAWLLVTALLFQMTIITGGRADWLAGLFVGAVAAVAYVRRQLRRGGRRGWLSLLGLLFALLAVAGGLAMNRQGVAMRVQEDSRTYAKILRGEYSRIDSVDIGSRFYLWRWGFHKWVERPVFGWGPGSRRVMIKHSDIPKYVTARFHHLHNTYLELAFGLGIVGLVLFAGVWVWLAWRVWLGLRHGRVREDAARFLLAAVAIFAIASITETYNYAQYFGWSYMALLGGALFGCGRGHMAQAKSSEPAES